MRFLTDGKRHLICEPYSIKSLHLMAEKLNIKHCWFHKNHYDIPKLRIEEIESQCEIVSPRYIVNLIKRTKQEIESIRNPAYQINYGTNKK